MAINKDRNLIKRGSVWYFRKKISGSSIKISLKTSSVSVARKIRNEYLYNINIYGSIHKTEKRKAPEFGELAVRWFKLNKNKLKKSTRRDYRNSLNNFILPKFRNIPIDQIEYLDIETFNSELKCKNKRLINLLIPMRNVFRFAHKNDYIDKNPMDLLDPIEPEKPDINPLSMREVLAIIDNVDRHYKNFFTFAFYTGMRFGEMSALKWKKVDFKLGIIKVRETRVQGEEGKPKTKGSIRDVKMFPMVVEALRDQRKATFGKSE